MFPVPIRSFTVKENNIRVQQFNNWRLFEKERCNIIFILVRKQLICCYHSGPTQTMQTQENLLLTSLGNLLLWVPKVFLVPKVPALYPSTFYSAPIQIMQTLENLLLTSLGNFLLSVPKVLPVPKVLVGYWYPILLIRTQPKQCKLWRIYCWCL